MPLATPIRLRDCSGPLPGLRAWSRISSARPHSGTRCSASPSCASPGPSTLPPSDPSPAKRPPYLAPLTTKNSKASLTTDNAIPRKEVTFRIRSNVRSECPPNRVNLRPGFSESVSTKAGQPHYNHHRPHSARAANPPSPELSTTSVEGQLETCQHAVSIFGITPLLQ